MASQEGYGQSVGSMPKALSYHGDDDEVISSSDVKPRILLMGLRRSGKSSIQKVGLFTSCAFLYRQKYLFDNILEKPKQINNI